MEAYTRQRLIAELTGEDTRAVSRAVKAKSRGVLLGVRGFNRNKIFTDIHFDIHRGEILGIWGLLGAGRTELIRALVGLDPIDSGSLRWQDKDGFIEIKPQQLGNRVGLITEDRRREGLFLPMSVQKNLSVANLKNLQRPPTPFIDSTKEAQISSGLISQLNIKVASSSQAVRTLSGGNQQKVIIGRWLAKDPDMYIMDEPIKGIDVSAKAEIKRIILELTSKGKSVLLISSELEEIVGFCDRYLVLCKGHLTAELPAEATPRQLMDAATSLQVVARQVEEVAR
ncbi:sugar ABC transporter ATP-binding protein [bacterium]|nr:sugar ABC transporter ATP-binding protein [bacterium]